MRRASLNVGASAPAKRAARASASSSSYCAATRIRFSSPELEIERIALGAVDGVGHGDDLDPAPRLVERSRACTARHLAQRAERRFDLFVGDSLRSAENRRPFPLDLGAQRAATPERHQPSGERARRDRAAVPREDPRASRSQRSRRSKKR